MAEGWKHTERPSADGWVNKMWGTHAKKYSSLRRKEALAHVTMWTSVGNIELKGPVTEGFV